MASVTTFTNDYQIGIITALPIERAAVTVMLDEHYSMPVDFQQSVHDPNRYTWGRIGLHKVVIASLAAGVYGTTMATATAMPLLYSFPNVKFGLMVGIGAGIPSTHDIRLGDVVVSQPSGGSGGVFQYDLGKAKHGEWERKDFLARPPDILLKALSMLQTSHELAIPQAHRFLLDAITKHEYWGKSYGRPMTDDYLFPSSYIHHNESIGGTCSACDPTRAISRIQRPSHLEFNIHYGIIGSGNSLVKDARLRDWIVSMEEQCICIEMEAAGLMNNFPCIVIRGICDYADSHKNDSWQRYACGTAAAFSKELLSFVPLIDPKVTARATDVLQSVNDQFPPRIDPAADSSVADSSKQMTTMTLSDQNYDSESVAIPTESAKMPEIARIPFLNEKNVNARSGEEDDTLLHSAVREGDLETVKLLISHGADVEARNKGSATPLYIAAQEGYLDVVKYLIEHKVDIEAKNAGGWTPLLIAASYGHPDTVNYLIEQKADIEAKIDGWTPLMVAAGKGHLDVAKYLIEHKADIEAKRKNGCTSLYIAAEKGHLDVIKYLIEQKADLEAKTDGCMPLMIAIQEGHLDVVKHLIEQKPDIEAKTDGFTPLFVAAWNSRLDVVKYLIEHKADIEAKTDGFTPLMIAAEKGHLDVVKYLIEQKADIEAKTNAFTPLFVAAGYGHLDVVKYLIEQKADIEAKNVDAYTPLMIAAANCHLEIVRTLLDNGANMRAKNNNGEKAIRIAERNGHEKIVELLKAYSDRQDTKKKNGFRSFFK